MPTQYALHKFGAHRHACLALYRALLRQSTSLAHVHPTISHSDHSFIRSTILSCFRRDRRLQSPTQIANGLRAGYEALDFLHSCVINNPSDHHGTPSTFNLSEESSPLARLTTLIASTRSLSTTISSYRVKLLKERPPPTPRMKRRLAHNARHSRKSAQIGRHGGTKKPVLERPLPLSEIRGGKRKVPQYIVTSAGIAFLRYTKPQPVALSRVIRQRLRRGEKLLEMKNQLDETRIWADDEDRWDKMIETQLSKQEERDMTSEKERWTHSVDETLRYSDRKFKENTQKNVEMGRKLWAVREREIEMAAAEKAERRLKRTTEQGALSHLKGDSLDADAPYHTAPET